MNYFCRLVVSIFTLSLGLSAGAFAVPTTFSVAGELEDHSFAQLFEFDVSGGAVGREVTFQTFASDGGTNAAGRVFNTPRTDAGPSRVDELSEGFEPWLSLFDSRGVLIEVVKNGFGSDESSQATDVLFRSVLAAGTYTLALTNAEPPNSDRLVDGFCFGCALGAQFERGIFIDNGPLWAIDFTDIEDVRALPGVSREITIFGVPAMVTVPEPQAPALLLMGCLLLVMRRGFSSMQSHRV